MSRQAGKSQTAAALALLTALLRPSLTLLLSPTLRQSGELFRSKFLPLYRPWRTTVPPLRETQLTLELANGSRVISLPESEEGIRGFSAVDLLVIDEAARVSDSLYRAVTPMLAVSGGRLIALSTPYGRRGWFFDAWAGSRPWERLLVTADQVPRITPDFLASERAAHGDRWFSQEYGCVFLDTVHGVFSSDDVARAVTADVLPLPLGRIFGG